MTRKNKIFEKSGLDPVNMVKSGKGEIIRISTKSSTKYWEPSTTKSSTKYQVLSTKYQVPSTKY